MKRLILLPLALTALAGCVPDVRVEVMGLKARELETAYDRCLGFENRDDFEKRLACTAGVYGGSSP